jgi:hypothetical protein
VEGVEEDIILPTPTPEPTVTPEPTPTPQPTVSPEPSAAPESAAASEPTATPELTPIPEPSPTPAPPPTTSLTVDTVYNNKSNASIWLTGSGFAVDDLLITHTVTGGNDYNAMIRLADSNKIMWIYDISLKSGMKSTGSAMYMNIKLDKKYAGPAFTLVHKKADGTYEYFCANADEAGNVKFGPLHELSPFMLVQGSLNGNLSGNPKTGDISMPLH